MLTAIMIWRHKVFLGTRYQYMVLNMRNLLIFLLTILSSSATHLIAGLHNIGSQRQFFFDDEIVESLENTRPRLNPAVKEETNPVIKREKPWESTDMRIHWVMYDHRLGKFRMRYKVRKFYIDGRDEDGKLIVRGEHKDDGVLVCEAFSDDGIHWEKPNLGLYEYNGSTDNNIIPEESYCDYVIQDLHDPDPARRYKGMIREGSARDVGMTLSYFYSPDGYNWTEYENNPVVDTSGILGRWGPITFTGWDPIRKVYAVYMENNYHMHSPHFYRSIGRAESPDMIHWAEPETILVTDDQDYPDTEFYWLHTMPYENWTVGLLWIFSTTNTTHHPEFVFSRDSIHFNRDFREPIIYRGDNGDFDSVSLYAKQPIVHDNEIYCFYYGTNWRSPEQLLVLGDKATAGIGLAKLPLDGFVSLEGAKLKNSVVTTRSFTFTGEALYLNMRAALQQWGAEPCEVKVEILDGRHKPFEGFTFSDADTVTTTGLNQKISWNGNTDVSSLQGKPVRLKIYFKNAKLYAFQFK